VGVPGTVLYCTCYSRDDDLRPIFYSTVQYSTVQYSTVQYSTVQYEYRTLLYVGNIVALARLLPYRMYGTVYIVCRSTIHTSHTSTLQ
jgi:hypothetical protein